MAGACSFEERDDQSSRSFMQSNVIEVSESLRIREDSVVRCAVR